MIRRTLELVAVRESGGRIALRSPGVGIYSGPPRPGEGLVPGSIAGTLTVLGRRIDLLIPGGVAGSVVEVQVKDRSTPVAWGQPLLELEPGGPASKLRGRGLGSAMGKEPAVAGAATPAAAGTAAPAVAGTAVGEALSGSAASSGAAAPSGGAASSGAAAVSGGVGSSGSAASSGAVAASGGAASSGAAEVSVAAGVGGAAHAGASDLCEGEYALRAPTTGVFYVRPDSSSQPFVSPGSTLETGQTAGLIEVMKCFSPIVHPGGAIPSPAIVERVSVQEGQEVRPGQILFVLRPA